jgi:Tfp pilus assembly protein PilN
MINLLPPELKKHYHYANLNTLLKHWIVGACLALVGIVVIATAGLLYLKQISHSYDAQVTAAKTTLQQQNIDGTRKTVNEISSDLKLSVQVLSKEVLFSKLLKQLATLTPPNTSLSSLNIGPSASAIDIAAETADYNAATQLQVNLADPNNKIFTKADIISINCGSDTGRYPCSVTIRALLAKNNPFLFINDKKVTP